MQQWCDITGSGSGRPRVDRPGNSPSPVVRAGFSLIELLVVMSILLLLAGAVLAFLGQSGAAARTAATSSLLVKLDSLLQARFDELRQSFEEQERKSSLKAEWINIPANAAALKTQYDAAGNGAPLASVPVAAARALVRIDRYRGAFPQRVEDLYGIDGAAGLVNGVNDDSPLLATWTSSTPVWNEKPRVPANHTRETESSELLYLALTVGVSAGAGKEVLSDINPKHIQDTDNDGLPELVDDWGNPLRFYNAPTRLVRPGGAGVLPTPTAFHALAQQLLSGVPAIPASPVDLSNSFNQNPFDSKGSLRNVAAGARYFEAAFTLDRPGGATSCPAFELNFCTPETFFRPLIVSAGADETLGLGEPSAAGVSRLAGVLTVDEAADNVTNRQRVGGP
jgi:prepilin-type N-terminal cleavage/methylation domain-containing protein